jgi:hypothetical protein
LNSQTQVSTRSRGERGRRSCTTGTEGREEKKATVGNLSRQGLSDPQKPWCLNATLQVKNDLWKVSHGYVRMPAKRPSTIRNREGSGEKHSNVLENAEKRFESDTR